MIIYNWLAYLINTISIIKYYKLAMSQTSIKLPGRTTERHFSSIKVVSRRYSDYQITNLEGAKCTTLET
jgi:hypothetical protein